MQAVKRQAKNLLAGLMVPLIVLCAMCKQNRKTTWDTISYAAAFYNVHRKIRAESKTKKKQKIGNEEITLRSSRRISTQHSVPHPQKCGKKNRENYCENYTAV